MGKIAEPLTLIVIFLLISISVWLFNTRYYASRALEMKAQEIATLVEGKDSLSKLPSELITTRPDILYLGIIDQNGVVMRSYGDKSLENMKKFSIPAPEGHTIILGLENVSFRSAAPKALIWSLLISFVFATIFFSLQYIYSTNEGTYLDQITQATKSVANGDFTAKLDTYGNVSSNRKMLKLFESFNLMVDHIARRQGGTRVQPSKFQPQVITTPKGKEHETKGVVTFVNRISSPEDVSPGITQKQYDEFLNQYRKRVTSIVNRYGGTIEAIFQGEIVAFFNAPKQIDDPELRAIFAGVEVLQALAVMNSENNFEGENVIGGRIGVDSQMTHFSPETGLPHNVKEVLTYARRLSNSASSWRVVISHKVFTSVKPHVEAKEINFEGHSVYSVIGVEETAINA